MQRPRFLPSNFILALTGAIILASYLPVTGPVAAVYGDLTTVAIAILFFLHGAKLSREAVTAGAMNWRLHLCVLAATFALFPIIGLFSQPLLNHLLTPGLAAGVLFLCLLPSTVQSSVAFTSIAGGNVPGAVCAATISNLLGVFLTPALAGFLMTQAGDAGGSLEAAARIIGEIVAPFALGQFARRWAGEWVAHHRKLVGFVDQGAIIMVVYGAFSASVAAGLWRKTPLPDLGWLLVVDTVLLVVLLLITHAVGKLLFSREDSIVLLFCGSKKSMASGIPIAQVLFASNVLGAIVLPLIIFHQIQLLVCAFIANRAAGTGSGIVQRA